MPEINLHWPLWPRQRQCLVSHANDQFFGGASEGGKSYACRVFSNLVGLECNNVQINFIRKKASDIEGYLDGNKGFRELLHPLTSTGQVEVTLKGIRYPNNNKLTFKHCQDDRQWDSAQGSECQILIKEEAPQIEERLIRAFDAWCRMTPEHLAGQPEFWQRKLPWKLSTGNPTGKSVVYFRKEYVKPEIIDAQGNTRKIQPFQIWESPNFQGRRQFVPSYAGDNLSINMAEHKARLAAIGDPQLAKALDEGDWDALIGEFFPEFSIPRHVIEPFYPPPHWFRFRTIDLGYAEPFAVYWWAVSDGEVFKDELGRDRWFPRGAFIIYNEWYGCDPDYPAKGLRMSNEEIAFGILQRSEINHSKCITLSDSLPFQYRGGEGADIVFAKCGVPLTRGDDSRVIGWAAMRSRLIGKMFQGFEQPLPMLYLTANCVYAIDYIPSLPRHHLPNKREDAAEHGETTHSNDSIRIGTLAFTVIKDSPLSIEVRTNREVAKTIRGGQTVKNLTGLRF